MYKVKANDGKKTQSHKTF